ncbi:MAG: putative pterin-4-alpha-carbinolamine dehydratase [Alphaproteobacteria bacterium MarineAlpha5_Bin11]|nr:4a-hydroxytetrahydrobiopterin dehydratase [Pelagibacteraceae bacterium]PPR43034.1 MAG: putative pterin-4-alpha-carbinolamine dehydratase [Alphaproteobacteria bacterium MarineAlpha5_Bin11]|tara:strand:+ start:10491 stop:10820 length:330 start_codon:yes stop_codon:yes gene_type:complete
MSDLSKRNCKPCKGTEKKFELNEIQIQIKKLNEWRVNESNEMIYKKYKFKNFKESIDFTNKVSLIAENENHHPDISIGWGYCLIMIHTHAIKGLSINDFILASKIDQIN